MIKRILVIEDDSEIAEYVRAGLSRAGYQVEVVTSVRRAFIQLEEAAYSAIVLDRMLPDREGLSVLAKLRADKNTVPVILVTAVSSVDERVRGLSYGADDYVIKPFHISELVARLAAIERRAQTSVGTESRLQHADLEIDLVSRQVWRSGRPIQLNAREFAILRSLLERAGEPVARRTLLKEVWNYDFDPSTNVVDVHVSRIRSKLSAGAEPQLVHSVRGIGYVLELK